MKIFVATSDQYIYVMPIFAYLFNKFWGDKAEVTVLNRGIINNYNLPNNFKIISLGKNEGINTWCKDFKEYFKNVSDKYFIFLQEDHLLLKPLNIKSYQALLSCLDDDKIGRICITNDIITKPYTPYKNINGTQILSSSQTAKYRASCQPSIWSKEFLLKCLPNLGGPWEFEMQHPCNDDYKVLGIYKDYPTLVSNAVLKGEFNDDWYKCIHGSDYFKLDLETIQHIDANLNIVYNN